MEGKHSKGGTLPAIEDIKDGLLKMILFTNLEDVKFKNKKYNSIPALKLTIGSNFSENNLTKSQKEIMNLLKEEASVNNFKILLK